jgi:hypothetical protein
MHKRDDWEKPRSHGCHLTEAEISRLRQAYKDGVNSRTVALELRCSSRVVSKYYGFFKAEGVRKTISAVPLRLPQQAEGSRIRPPTKAQLTGCK